MTPVSAIIIGEGQRGAQVYSAYAVAHPERLRIAAVAEPDPEKRAAAGAVRTSAAVSLESHLLGFAAEHARQEQSVVELASFGSA